ncbi:MAG: hypothetical protein WCH39_26750 [Schlesneria sp.]
MSPFHLCFLSVATGNSLEPGDYHFIDVFAVLLCTFFNVDFEGAPAKQVSHSVWGIWKCVFVIPRPNDRIAAVSIVDVTHYSDITTGTVLLEANVPSQIINRACEVPCAGGLKTNFYEPCADTTQNFVAGISHSTIALLYICGSVINHY